VYTFSNIKEKVNQMNIDEFLKTSFSIKTKVEYRGKFYRIISINFDEYLLTLDNGTAKGLRVSLKYIDGFKDV